MWRECFCLHKHWSSEKFLFPNDPRALKGENWVESFLQEHTHVAQPLLVSWSLNTQVTLHIPPLFISTFILSFKMVCQLSGLFLLLLESSIICGRKSLFWDLCKSVHKQPRALFEIGYVSHPGCESLMWNVISFASAELVLQLFHFYFFAFQAKQQRKTV